MTDAEINVKLAEALGWTEIGTWRETDEPFGKHPSGLAIALPNYTGSYDTVMLEVRKLKGRKIDEFCRNLEPTNNPLWKDEPMPDCNPSRVIDWCLISATAKQYTIALILTLTSQH